MSKKRPSKITNKPARISAPPTVKERPLQWWKQRVFKNSYTHQGRLVKVKGWSVKIQYQGHRRTISLHSRERTEAASEAAHYYQKIINEGWKSVVPMRVDKIKTGRPIKDPAPDSLTKMDARYWEDRLLQRKYPHVGTAKETAEWSVRIEHDGMGSYFPLGSFHAKTAATKALAIFKTIKCDGWEEACDLYSREITIGIQWTLNPVAWTYTTFYTQVADRAVKASGRADSGLGILIVEPDRAVRRALQHWVKMAGMARVVACYGTAKEVLQRASPTQKELWLVNRILPDMGGHECLEQMRRLVPKICGVIYSLHEDSNHLFLATPGGASAYLLKRTPPEKVLEPLFNASPIEPISPKEILLRVRQYFQTPLASVATNESVSELENLTVREHEILALLSKGYVDKEIAGKLGISAWTVHGHMKNIFEKLKVHTRTEAVVKFLQK